MAPRAQRITVGFAGGQVLSLRVSVDELKSLENALVAGGWHEIQAEDGVARMNTDQVAYLRVDSDEAHVGFGA